VAHFHTHRNGLATALSLRLVASCTQHAVMPGWRQEAIAAGPGALNLSFDAAVLGSDRLQPPSEALHAWCLLVK
jgi:hypothetical protein